MNLNKRKILTRLVVITMVSLLFLAATFFLPLLNMAAFKGKGVSVWIWITHTGGTLGIFVLLLVFSFVLSWDGALKENVVKAGYLFLFLGATVGLTALINEVLIKEKLMVQRPSIRFMEREIGLDAHVFYQQETKKQRREYLKNYLLDHPIHNMQVKGHHFNEDVLQVWVKETGYSFPSGHAVSSFLVSVLLGYLLLLKRGARSKYGVVLLFLWALAIAYSRVILGVHTSLDVFLGAAWGSLIGFLLIRSGVLKKMIILK